MDADRLHRGLLLAIVSGFAFSLYATFEVVNPGLSSACSLSQLFSCGAVARSGLTTFPPGTSIPDWSWGIGGFAAMLGFDIPLFRNYDVRWLWVITILSTVGVGISAYLAYLEVAVIHAICPICLGAYISDIGVLTLAILLLRLRHRVKLEDREPEPAPKISVEPVK